MTPEEREEIDQIKRDIGNILTALKSQQADLTAKAGDLEAKARHLDILTSTANATRVLLSALQLVLASKPGIREELSDAVAQVIQHQKTTYCLRPCLTRRLPRLLRT